MFKKSFLAIALLSACFITSEAHARGGILGRIFGGSGGWNSSSAGYGSAGASGSYGRSYGYGGGNCGPGGCGVSCGSGGCGTSYGGSYSSGGYFGGGCAGGNCGPGGCAISIVEPAPKTQVTTLTTQFKVKKINLNTETPKNKYYYGGNVWGD